MRPCLTRQGSTSGETLHRHVTSLGHNSVRDSFFSTIRKRSTCSQILRGSTRCWASHYETLGVDATSSEDDIKIAFRRAAKRYHPDVSNEPGAQERFIRINEAYQTLSDSKQRAEYDLELRRGRSTSGRAETRRGSDYVEYTWVVNIHDIEDEEDEDDLIDFFNWSNKNNNYRSSFQSSWQANAKRRQRQEAEVRAAAERQAREQAAAQAQAQAAARGRGHGYYSSMGHPGSAAPRNIGGFTPEDILASLGPEARATAQNVFGMKLQGLDNVEQLSDFMDMLEILQSDMGIEVDLCEDDSSDDDSRQGLDSMFSSGKASGGRASSASARSRSRPGAPTSSKPSRPSASQPRASNWQADVDWATFVSDFDSGSSAASKARRQQQPPRPRGPGAAGAAQSQPPGATSSSSSSSSGASDGVVRGKVPRARQQEQQRQQQQQEQQGWSASSRAAGPGSMASGVHKPWNASVPPAKEPSRTRAAAQGRARHSSAASVYDSDDDGDGFDDFAGDERMLQELFDSLLTTKKGSRSRKPRSR